MAHPFQVGVQLPEVEREVGWLEMRDIARTAESAGFDSLWLGDHLLYRDQVHGTTGPMEAWSTLAALAEATERVSLGTLVASTSFHAPAMLAKKAATIDEISGGRLILGLGAGWNRTEYEAFGFPFDHRIDRFEEAFAIIRALLTEGHVDFQGSHYTVRDAELVPRARPGIPLLIGSNGPRMLKIALPHVAMWNTWHSSFGNDVEKLGPLLEEIDRACADAGREPGEVEKSAAIYVQTGRRYRPNHRTRRPPGRRPSFRLAGRPGPAPRATLCRRPGPHSARARPHRRRLGGGDG